MEIHLKPISYIRFDGRGDFATVGLTDRSTFVHGSEIERSQFPLFNLRCQNYEIMPKIDLSLCYGKRRQG
jgi:hypothetical protein